MPSLLFEPRPQLIDTNGDPIEGGYWEFWEAGTSTPKNTFDDYNLTSTNPNPIRTAIDGRPKDNINIFLSGAYKVDARDANNVSLPGYPVDNVVSYSDYNFDGLTATIKDLNSTTTTALTKTADYTIIETDRGKTIMADASAADMEVVLLPVATAGDKYKIIIKKTDNSTHKVTIKTNVTETVDAIDPYILYDYNDFIEVHCDGSNYKVVAYRIRGTIEILAATVTLDLKAEGKMFNIDAAGGDITITLPSAVTVGKGFQVSFKRIDTSAFAVVIDTSGAQTIDGESLLSLLTQYEFYSIKSDGLVWFIIAEASAVGGFATGDVKTTFRTAAQDPGWIAMGDGTIGNASSTADYANINAKDLFILLWDNVADAWAPVVTGRGGSALADWNADKKLTLCRSLGRVLGHSGAGAGLTPRAVGEYLGEETHILTIAELAAHIHPPIIGTTGIISAIGAGNTSTGAPGNAVSASSTGFTGSDTAHNNMQPSLFMSVHIKL